MTMPRAYERYSVVAIALHWSMAILILANFPLAWWMVDALNDPATQARAFEAYQLHKSIGLTVLALSVVRLAWRLTHRPPPLPDHMPAWEKWGARFSHIFLYVVMLAIPLTGWIYVSAGWNAAMNAPFAIPTLWFGQFEWPHIGFIAELDEAGRASAAALSLEAHELVGWAALALVALHAAAALKHQLIDRDAVLPGMLPLVKPRRPRADAINP